MTEALFNVHTAGNCFQAHRKLFEAAAVLARQLSTTFDDADLFQLGGVCMRIAAESALQTSDPKEALRRWQECTLAERQIRIATYRALRAGCIDNELYDGLFRLAKTAARVREDERLRLRWRLLRLV
ncbi:MAG: hypothetical protein JWN44_4829 [Myxococcales bacterium]|nr:hypothetical protein [Myxococcales bacterium]